MIFQTDVKIVTIIDAFRIASNAVFLLLGERGQDSIGKSCASVSLQAQKDVKDDSAGEKAFSILP